MRLIRLTVACTLAALAVPLSAFAGERMLIGFQDDPNFRWRDDRQVVLDRAQEVGASILRTTVYWSRIAPTKPASPSNPFDPAYRLDDLDEFVRGAGLRGMEVMLTIWGTPPWANGGKGQNFAPSNFGDLTSFARAVAGRYSGKYPGYPFVRYFTVWNESNLGQFLSPQYDGKGKPAAPAIYAKLYRAAYAGIKAGNPKALVGVGETSPRGRDRVLGRPGLQETESPGKFAELLSKQRPKLKFDAWSHHPYSTLGAKPTQAFRWPNVNLTQIARFGQELDKWFGRKDIPMWITEYGHETKPGEPKGVTYAQQADYVKQALGIARKNPRVQMFIWFILRDDPTSLWQSGLMERDGSKKPSFAAFSALAKLLDARNPLLTVTGSVANPVVKVPVLELWSRSGAGVVAGINVRVFQGAQLVGNSQPQVTIGFDGWVSFPAPVTTQKGNTYRVTAEITDKNGNRVDRTITLVAK